MRDEYKILDYLVNLATDKENYCYKNFHQIQSTGKMIINNDKSKCPYIWLWPKRGEGDKKAKT